MSVNKQLNMQISNEEEILEPLRKLNLLDDFLFDVATVDLETCKIILELSLGIRIKKLSWREDRKSSHNLPDIAASAWISMPWQKTEPYLT